MAKTKEKPASKTNLTKIVDPLQKLLDQRAALDEQIAAMKKDLIAAIENEEAPARPKPSAGRKPGAKKAEAKTSAGKAPRGRKAGSKKKPEDNEL